jgi:hypothetical protein
LPGRSDRKNKKKTKRNRLGRPGAEAVCPQATPFDRGRARAASVSERARSRRAHTGLAAKPWAIASRSAHLVNARAIAPLGYCRLDSTAPLHARHVWERPRDPPRPTARSDRGDRPGSRATPDHLCGRAPPAALRFCQFTLLILTANFDRYYSTPIAARKSTGKIIWY